MRGRPIDGWLRVAPAALTGPDGLARWVQIALGYARTLAPKS